MTNDVREWGIDGPNTHGEEGLACVTDGVHVGVGPDEIITGTVDDVALWLVRSGYREIDTDEEELARAFRYFRYAAWEWEQ